MNDSSALLKSLTHQIAETKLELSKIVLEREKVRKQDELLKEKIRAFEVSIAAARHQIEKLKIKESKRASLLVSEHCILRYLERYKNINIEEIKQEILSENTLLVYNSFGDGKYPHPSGGRIVIKDNVAVTFEN